MKKKLAILSTTIMLGLGGPISIPTVKADTQQSISQANLNISQAKVGLAAVKQQMDRVNQAITENNKKIAAAEKEITDKNNEVNQLQTQISALQVKIEQRNDVLKKRAQSFQETGGNVSYINVLMDASSFRDFVDRVGAVAQLVEADNNLLTQQETDKQALEQKQASVQKVLADLTSLKSNLDGMKAELTDQKVQQEANQATLQQKQQDGYNQLANLMAQEQHSADAAISSFASAPAAPSSGSISTVIQAGYKYIGRSVYVFGGGRTVSDITNGFFDCSGFVHWAYAQAGVNLGWNTGAMLGNGVRVPASQMRPGDLVFFDTYASNSHVGIYIGGGNFIGSQSSTGVAVASMSNVYWSQHFKGVVVRVIN
ncbi:coiled-coil domain-containing protein [Neobacillus ginsengisoli]|uniref:Peptidoglycan hydrolase CwlO-like protein n=1 Tax=Neobacillus ginsengisoli TaxID=904295 RepID=A0ABT9Y0V7_9BACI|nr:C40 family peptidase [Neobacillus ginsengisoli]MDQ0201226.1 peptidoglycan hydrolase CwlO-like protein [Neobacillus ginsengisoli]